MNVLADCFLGLPQTEKTSVGDREQQAKLGTTIYFKIIIVTKDDEDIMDGETFHIDTYTTTNESYYATFMEIPELMEWFLNLPALDFMPDNPTTITNIINHQMRDQDLIIINLTNNQYAHHEIQGQDVVIYYPDEQDRLNWNIAIPRTLTNDLLLW